MIVFHGVGGVGKSTLLRKIEAALSGAEHRPDQWGAPTWTQPLLPIRIDLSRSASTGSDFERVILTIRLALAGALGRTLPSFDVALRHYLGGRPPRRTAGRVHPAHRTLGPLRRNAAPATPGRCR